MVHGTRQNNRKEYMKLKQISTEQRKNRFTGESIVTPAEAIKHDRIFINELAATLEDKAAGFDGYSAKYGRTVREDINWFRQHNAKAYMVLLD
jgi:hypothetical protein